MEATAATLERRVRVIPATRKPEELHRDHDGKMRVAAYCRVSTDSEEQLNSYEAQKTYYTQKIQDSPDWEMAGIYADEGISGTRADKRPEFQRMIRDCQNGKIDYIITKSVSRFARNTVDTLNYTRELRGMGIPVIDPKTGVQKVDKRNRKQWKRVTVSENPLGTKAMLLSMRESWADVCNGLLPEGVRIDHRSLEEQGIDRVPTIHEGYASREMEKRGQPSDRMAINREIGASNRDLAEGDAAVDALRAHQSELRRLLRDMADRAAQAFDRMLESIGHGVDPSDAVEAMRDRDGINLMIPRNAKDSDRPVWHAWLYDRHEWAAIPSHVLREGMRTVGRVRAAIGTALHRWRDAQAARRERSARSTPAQAPRLADVARQAREDAGQPAHQPRPVRKPEQQPEQQRERPVSLAAAAKEASKQLKREQQQEPEPEPALEWNPWDPADPMNLGMGGSQGYGLGL